MPDIASAADGLLPVEPPCDACFEPVRFDPCARRFAHTVPTPCQGIDGLILDVPRREWEDLRRRRSVNDGGPAGAT